MAAFVLTPGADSFSGPAGQFNLFYFTPSTLQSGDVLAGGASGVFSDVGLLTAAGAVGAGQFSGVSGLEQLRLSGSGNTVTLPDALVAGSSAGFLTVIDGSAADWSIIAVTDTDGDHRADLVWRSSAGIVSVNGLVTPLSLSSVNGTIGSTWSGMGPEWHLLATPDTNGDGKSDLLWQSDAGMIAVWQLNGSQIAGGGDIGGISPDWHFAGRADFNGDAKTDLLWRNDNGSVVVWQMNDSQAQAIATVGSAGNEWHILGTADFNADSRADILWRNDDGAVSVWQMNGTQLQSAAAVGSAGNDWHVITTADFNADGRADILWRNDDGAVSIWQMNGTQLQSAAAVGSAGNDWHILGTGDFNGDGRNDILWQNDNGQVVVWQMNGTQVQSIGAVGSIGAGWHFQTTNEFNGDGKTDILWRNDDGSLSIWNMNGTSLQSIQTIPGGGDDTIDASAAIAGHSVHAVIGGGSDTVVGGAADDQIITPNSNFASIDGGGGNDRLTLSAPGQVFSLTANAAKIHNTEVLWLDDAANTDVTLGGADIVQVSAATNSLYVVGGPDDHVQAGNNWGVFALNVTNAAIAPGHTFTDYQYINGSHLFIDNAVRLDIIAGPTIPVDANGAANRILEGAANGTAVGITAASSDPGGSPVVFSLTGDSSGGGFQINSATGVVTVANSSLVDFESASGHAYAITVRATAGIGFSQQAFTINVDNAPPSTPVDSVGPVGGSIAEGAAVGSTVGIRASSSDPNGPAVTFSLTGDSSGGGFQIDPATGVVTVANSTKIDFETSGAGHNYTITAQASDGALTSAQSFVIVVTDVGPSTPVDSNGPTGGSVAEGAANGSAVGITVSSGEPNGPAASFALTNNAGGRFAINASTGVVTVANGTLLDFESSGPSHAFTITAQATSGALTSSQAFTIGVTNVAPTAPNDADPAANGVLEGAALNTAVGVKAASTDPNGPSPTLSITGDSSGGGFKMDPDGTLRVNDPTKIDFESAPGINHSYDVTVQAADGQGGTSTQTFNIPVGNVNPTAPTEVNDGTPGGSVAEGAAVDTLVGITAASSDINGPPVSWSIVNDTSGGGFKIGADGAVSVADSTKIDFESTAPGHSHSITVRASDGGGGFSDTVFAIGVTNVNPLEPFDSEGGPNGSVAEGAAADAVVGITAFSTDANGPNVSYSIVSDSSGSGFKIDPSSGVISVADGAKIDYETAPGQAYSIVVQTSDGQGGLSPQHTFTVAVIDVNDNAPVFSSGTTGGEGENTSTANVVYAAQATDADGTAANNTIAFSLSSGGDNDLFIVDGSTGFVTFKPFPSLPPDFESPADADHNNAYQITVHANDGGFDVTRDVTITITDVNDNAPVFQFPLTSVTPPFTGSSTPENNAAYSFDAHATDADATAPHNSIAYSLTGPDSGLLSINASGIVTFNATPNSEAFADFDHDNIFQVTVHAIDNGVHDVTRDLRIAVTDTNDNTPVFSSGTTGSEAENTAATNIVYTAQASDADATAAFNTIQFSLQSGVGDNNLFNIGSATGEVRFNAAPDFEAVHGPTYNIVVTASDGTNSATKSVTVSVTDLNDNAPVFQFPLTSIVPPFTADSTAENNGSYSFDAHATDADVSNTITYSLTGEDAGDFTISSTGVLTFNVTPDFEAPADLNLDNVYKITVHAQDNGGAHDTTRDMEITVTDAADVPPGFTSGTTGSEAEGTVNTNVVYTATTSPSAGVTFTLPALFDNALFAIDSDDGELRFLASPNFEAHPAAYHVVVQANAAGFTPQQDVFITVTDVAPNAPAANGPGSVLEGAAAGSAVGIPLAATDFFGSDTVNFLLSNNAGGRFTIDSSNPNDIKVVVANASLINYETSGGTHSYTIAVVASTSGGTATTSKVYTVNVGNVAPTEPGTDIDPSTDRITTAAADLTPVGITAFWSDPNGGPLTYSFSATDTQTDVTGTFQIDATTGVISLKASHTALTGVGTSYTFDVQATDGAATTATKQFIVPVVANNFPTIDLNGPGAGGNAGLGYTPSPGFQEGGAVIPIADTDVEITDPAATQLVSATITLTNAQAGDTLTVNPAALTGSVITGTGITASVPVVDAGTIKITLTGASSLDNYEIALKAIRFNNTSENPNTTPRVINVVGNDGTNDSNIAQTTITVDAVNDAPAFTSVPAGVSYNEDAGATALFAGAVVSDPDNPLNFSSVDPGPIPGGSFTVEITANADTFDQIVLLGSAPFSISGSDLLQSGHVIGTINGLGTALVQVTELTSFATPAVANQLIHAFGFLNPTDDPAASPDRTVTFTFTDGGNTGTPGAQPVSTTQTVHVNVSNDAPVAESETEPTIAEDDPAGVICNAFAIDPDNNAAPFDTLTYSIVTSPTHGTLDLTNFATTGAFVYHPNADFNGTDFLEFKVNDGSVDSNVAKITFNVSEVNDASTAVNDGPLSSIAEDSGTRVISIASLTGNDTRGPATATDEAGQTLNITLANITNIVGGTVQIVGTDILFTPNADFNGAASFKYKVTDNGTTNGAADPQTSAATADVTFNVTAVNDAPVNTVPFGTVAATQNVAKTITGLSVTDVDAGSANITVTLHVVNGTLTIDEAVGGGLVTADITGNGSDTVVLTGSQSKIDITLAGANAVLYTSATLGPDTLTMTTDDGGATGTDPGLTGTGTSEADIDTVAIQVSAAISANGQLWYLVNDVLDVGNTGTDNYVGHINVDGTSPTAFNTVPEVDNDIAVDKTAGYYFVLDSLQNLTPYAIAGHTPGTSVTVGASATAADALALDPTYATIFVSVVGATTGIQKVSYNTTTGVLTPGTSLIDQTVGSVPTFVQAIDIAVDAANRLLYYVDDDAGTSNGIYVVNYDGGASPATATTATSLVQFNPDGAAGFIESVAVDNRGTASTADDIIYFVTSDILLPAPGTASLWYLDRFGGNTTPALLTNAPSLAGASTHTGLSFDQSAHQLYVSSQDIAGTTDAIIQIQLDGAGHTAVSSTPYSLPVLTSATPENEAIPGQTALTLPLIAVHAGSFAEANPVSTPAALDSAARILSDPAATLKGAVVMMTGGFFGSNDVLAATVAGTSILISSNTTDANGNITLVLSGDDTAANYQSVLRSITFTSGDNPTSFGNNAARTITWHLDVTTANDAPTTANTQTSTLTVAGANDAPVAAAGANSGNEDHAIAGQAVATDVDNTAAQLTYSLDTTVNANGGALNGTVTISASGAYIYTPNAGFSGSDSFNFRANDGGLNSNSAAISITVNAVNDAPVVDLLAAAGVQTAATTATFTETSPAVTPVFIAPAVTLSDDDPNLTQVVVTQTNFKTDDILKVSGLGTVSGDLGNIHFNINNGAHTVTLTPVGATATVAEFQAGLRLVQFDNAGENPDTTPRTFTIDASDGLLTGTATATVNFTATNDAPALDLDLDNNHDLSATTAFTTSYTVSTAAVPVVDTDVTITDVDNTNAASATVVLTKDAAHLGDSLTVQGALPGGITANISENGTTITVTLTGVASFADYQTALRQIVFANGTDPSQSDSSRTIDISVKDQGNQVSNVAQTTIAVTHNTAPTAGAESLTATEKGGANNSTGGSNPAPGNVLTNDSDTQTPSGLTVVSFGAGTTATPGAPGTLGTAFHGLYGALTLSADGSYTYALDNSNATVQALVAGSPVLDDEYHYTIQDGGGLPASANFIVHISGADDLPLAVTDLGTMNEESAATNFLVRANDSLDPDTGATNTLTLGPAGITVTSGASNITPFQNTDASAAIVAPLGVQQVQVTLTNSAFQQLKAGESATVTVPYSLAGNGAETSTANLIVTVNGATDLPLAFDDSPAAITEDANLVARTFSVLGNDTLDADHPDTGSTTHNKIITGAITVLPSTPGGLGIDAGDVGVATDAGNTQIIVTLGADFQKLQVGQTAAVDIHYTLQGNAGELSGADLHLLVTGVNDNPVVTAGAAGSFTENAVSPSAVVPNLTLSDIDNATLSKVTVALNNIQTGDVLSVSGAVVDGNLGSGVHYHFASPSVIEFTTNSGTPTLVDYQNAVHAVQFTNPLDNLSNTARSFTVTADDGQLANNTGSANASFTVVAVNDAPVNTIPGGDHYASSNTATAITGLSVADVDANPDNVQVTLGLNHGGAIAIATGVAGGLTAGQIATNGTSSVVITAPLAAINATFANANGVTYTSSAAFNGLDPTPANNVETLQVTTNDLGHNPSGALTDQDPLPIGVLPKVWYIDNTANGDDDLSAPLGSQKHPFTSIAAFNAVNDGGAGHPAAGDTVFVRSGTYDSAHGDANGITLLNNQKLIGEGDGLAFQDPFASAGTNIQVVAAGVRPIISVSGTAIGIDLASGNTVHGLDVATAAAGAVGIDDGAANNSVGSLSISNMQITGSGKAIDIDHGGALSVTLDKLTSTGSSSEGIDLGGNVTGSFTVNNNTSTISGAAGTDFNISTNGLLDVTFNGDITQASNAALVSVAGGHTGTVTFQNGTLTATNGSGLQFNNADGTYNFNGTNTLSNTVVNATADAGIDITNGSNGNFSFSSNTSIKHQQGSGNAVDINGGAGNFSYAGTIGATDATDGTGLSVSVQNHTAGTVTFSGNILDGSDAGGGILLNANTGGTYNFTGPSITLDTGAVNGVSLTGNNGATITFNNATNGLDITTTSGAGFTATGGGTVNVQAGGGNSINSGAGTALNISNTTIGSGATFHDISANGGTNGIVLVNTGGGAFTVTGDGSNTAQGGNSSGGTIQHLTGADGTTQLNGTSNGVGIGVYLSNASNVTLQRMNIHDASNFGVDVEGSSNFVMKYTTVGGTNGSNAGQEESSVRLLELGGTNTLDNNDISGGFTDNVRLDNHTAALTDLIITNNKIHDNNATTGNQGILVDFVTGAAETLHITGNTFSHVRAESVFIGASGGAASNAAQINATVTNNTFTGNRSTDLGGGFEIQTANFNGHLRYDISGNTLQPVISASNFAVNQGSAIQVSAAGAAGSLVEGRINNNHIGTNGVVHSGTQQGSGITVDNTGSGTHTTLITNNDIQHFGNTGIAMIVGGSGLTTGTFNATITGNTIHNTDATTAGSGTPNGINGNFGTNAGNAETVNLDISGNTLGGSGANGAIGEEDFRLRERFNADVFLKGYNGGSGVNDTASVVSFVQAQNTGAETGSASVGLASPPHGFHSLASVPQPSLPPLLAVAGGVAAALGGQDTTGVEYSLTQAELDSVAAAAIGRWAAAGLSADQIALLQHVTLSVSDLSDAVLGQSDAPGQVTIDVDGAGHGWFVDPTPNDDAEFAHSLSTTRLQTDPTEAPAGHMDLLTTVMHELGHQIGLDDTGSPDSIDDLMFINLVDGERRLPDIRDVVHAQQGDAAEIAQAAEDALPTAAAAPVGTLILAGTEGNDTLKAGPGGAILVGGAAADTFVFDQAPQPTASAPAAAAHIADYSAAQGDTIDLSAITGGLSGPYVTDAMLIRAAEDGSGAFATLQVNVPNGVDRNEHWVDIAQVDGVHAGDTLNVVLDPSHAPHQIHAEWLV
jgi:VCBS repeat-containing protein